MKPLATALSELMQERRMSQTDVWAAANLSSTVLSRYLSGERGRRINKQAAETIEKIAPVLGVEPDYFVEYRQWRVQEITRTRPALVDQVYDLLIALDRSAGGSSK